MKGVKHFLIETVFIFFLFMYYIYDSDEVDFFKGSLHNQEQYNVAVETEPRK